jgi:hypothetical protein
MGLFFSSSFATVIGTPLTVNRQIEGQSVLFKDDGRTLNGSGVSNGGQDISD